VVARGFSQPCTRTAPDVMAKLSQALGFGPVREMPKRKPPLRADVLVFGRSLQTVVLGRLQDL